MDEELAIEWVPMLESYGRISGAPSRVGSKYLSELKYDGYEFEQVSEIKAIRFNQYIRWSTITKFCDGECEYFLKPRSDIQTEFKHIIDCRYKGFSKILAWLAKPVFERKSEAILDEMFLNFKSLVEARYLSEIG